MTTLPHLLRRSHRYWQLVVGFFALIVLVLVLQRLTPILSPLVAALGIAYLLDPPVEYLARHGIPRAAAVALILIGFGIVMTAVVAILIPLIAGDARRFATEIPHLADRTVVWARGLGLEIPHDWPTLLSEWGAKLRDMLAGAAQAILGSVASLFSSVVGFLFGLLNLLIVPVFAFYFLMDWGAIRRRAGELVPPRNREVVYSTAREIDAVISSWVRGQLTLVMVQATLYPIALSIVGIQLAVPIGILAGLLTIVPYVGGIVGAVLSIAMALLGWNGPGPLVGVIIVFVVMNILEGFVLTPILVGRKVGLSDTWALIAVLAGGELLGFVGVLLAIPLAAASAVILRRLGRAYLGSRFYQDGAPALVAEEEPPPPESP